MPVYDTVRFIAAAGVFVLSGRVILKFVYRADVWDFGPGAGLGISFLLGLGALSLQMFFYSLVSIGFGFWTISVPWIVLTPATWFFLPVDRVASRPKKRTGSSMEVFLKAMAFFIIASQAAYAFIYAGILPVKAWDAFVIWFFKARVFFVNRGVPESFLTDGTYASSHLDYPLLLPLSVTWVYTAMGGAKDAFARLIYPIQYLSMLAVFHYTIRKAFEGRNALIFTALLCLVPLIMVHTAGFGIGMGNEDKAGYADIILSVYFMGAGAFYYLYSLEGRPGHIILSALFLAMGAWTKNEGIPFAAVSVILFAAGSYRKAGLLTLFKAAVLPALFIAPWMIFRGHLNLTGEYTSRFTVSIIGDNLWRVRAAVTQTARYMFTMIDIYNFTWWGLVFSCLLNWRGFFSRKTMVLLAMVLAQFSFYVVAYTVSPADLNWHISTSLDRLILHMVPFAVLLTAININTFLFQKVNASQEAV